MGMQTSELKQLNCFSGLADDTLALLGDKLCVMKIAAGEEVVTAGASGDAFYVVKEGMLEVMGKTLFGREAKLSVIREGQGFGETSLLTGFARTCSIRALSPATLFRVPKKDFEVIVRSDLAFLQLLLKQAEEFLRYNKVKTLQPFALLEPDKMSELLPRISEKTYAAGEDIIVQGERGDCYYIVKSGRVAVLKKGGDDTPSVQAAVLSAGDGFGEEALIRDDPRNATCRAIKDTTVYVLEKEAFLRILLASFLENVYSEDLSADRCQERYVFIDARVPVEYEEGHIQGAVNIPLEELRGKFSELDPAKEYITYCLNDGRGMVAAYLLRTSGFNAKCLRGGISSWTGPVSGAPGGRALLLTGPEKPAGLRKAVT